MTADQDIWDDLFHGTAWEAFVEVWRLTGQFPPDSEATRRLAYRLYEEALAEKNRNALPTPARPATMPPRRLGEQPHVLGKSSPPHHAG
jgi:hypothetical protein